MPELTNDEIVCLTIMGAGENMLAIGRWKEPLEHLTELSYARNTMPLNYVITKSGREQLAAYDKQSDNDFLRILSGVKTTRNQAASTLEQAAQNLVDAAKAQHELTGELPNTAVWSLGQEIIKRALEILKA